MADKIQCVTHGEREQTLVCDHLAGKAAGLGFNRDAPTNDDPFPDALGVTTVNSYVRPKTVGMMSLKSC